MRYSNALKRKLPARPIRIGGKRLAGIVFLCEYPIMVFRIRRPYEGWVKLG